MEQTAAQFGGIDVVVNNASAINLSRTEDLPMKAYDLMNDINCRGSFLLSKLSIPWLRKSTNNPHILTLSPPISTDPKWFGRATGYTIAKFGMSLVTLGLSEELREDGIAANSLWPRTADRHGRRAQRRGGRPGDPLPHAIDHGGRRLRDPHQAVA